MLTEYKAAEIHVGETYRVEVVVTQDLAEKPVIICECTVTKADGTVVCSGVAHMADMLRIHADNCRVMGQFRKYG